VRGFATALAIILTAPAPAAIAQAVQPKPPPAKPAAPAPIPTAKDRIRAAVLQLEEAWEPAPLRKLTQDISDAFIAHGSFGQPEAIVEGTRADRLVALLDKADHTVRRRILKHFRENHDAGSSLLFAIAKEDDPSAVVAVYDRLLQERPEQVKQYANLAAAIALVHDAPADQRKRSFPRTRPPDPLECFDYFVASSRGAVFNVKSMPPEALVYVVDGLAGVDELAWAASRYKGRRAIGQVFFDVTYDDAAFREGREKRIADKPFTLPNLKLVGGVCIEQAYYASQAGKALAIPTAIAGASGSTVGHAWIGYLEAAGGGVRWNFENGRYDEYKGLAGKIVDPQSGREITDGELSLSAAFVSDTPADRYGAIALTLASDRVRSLPQDREIAADRSLLGLPERSGSQREPPKAARTASRALQLELLEAAVGKSPACAAAWRAVSDMGAAGKLETDQRARWTEAVIQMCGRDYPDFALAFLRPIFLAEKDAAQQSLLWDWAYGKFISRGGFPRADLAASIRFSQGLAWEKAGDNAKAWACYQWTVDKFPNDGPYVVDAVRKCEGMLRQNKMPISDVVALYKNAWQRVQKPDRMSPGFAQQSSWAQIGSRYVEVLREAGRANDARTAEQRIAQELQLDRMKQR
jgi:hypothetical protein